MAIKFETSYFKGVIFQTIRLSYGSHKYIGQLFWKDTGMKYCYFHCCAPDVKTLILKIENDMFVDYKYEVANSKL